MPASRQRAPKASLVYGLPWSPWSISPAAGRRVQSAISSAASTSPVRMCAAMPQPTTLHDLEFAPHLNGFAVQVLTVEAEHVELRIVAVASQAACPVCRQPSARVHSRYERRVADLPWSRARVVLRVLARRFRCVVADCPRRIFCERLPGLVAVYARCTEVLAALLRALGFALGGRPGRRLLGRLLLRASRSTLLRLVRRALEPPPPRAVRVLSVDEWAYRRGRADGLILVDLEQHRVLDLLPNNSAATVATWLRTHPGVEIFSRDRSGPFAEATRRAAPHAVQLADRFHLPRNLGRVAERVLRRHATLIGRLPAPGHTSRPASAPRCAAMRRRRCRLSRGMCHQPPGPSATRLWASSGVGRAGCSFRWPARRARPQSTRSK